MGEVFKVQNGDDIRDFVYIEDIVEILRGLITQRKVGVVNIGSGAGVRVEDLARSVSQLLGQENLILYGEKKVPKSIVISNPKRLISLYGEYSWTPLTTALTQSIEARTRNSIGSKEHPFQ
jgi:nucleoside-diphosphate-sugar epimerase